MAKIRYLLVFLAGGVLGWIGGYIGHSYQYETGRFDANRIRNQELESVGGRKWAEQIALVGVPNFHKVSDDLLIKHYERLKDYYLKTVENGTIEKEIEFLTDLRDRIDQQIKDLTAILSPKKHARKRKKRKKRI